MLVELGNPHPHDGTPDKPLPGPAVTTVSIPDDLTCAAVADAKDLALHLAQNPQVTQLPDHEAFLAVAHPTGGVWGHGGHGFGTPSWVAVSGPDPEKVATLQKLLAEFYNASEGHPANLEDTHHTRNGPPGVGPEEG